jgi:hypothetical protein
MPRITTARLWASLGALSIAAAFIFAGPAAAGRAPAAAAPAAATCPTYPFGPGPSVSISTTTPFPGQSVTIRGVNFNKNAHVAVQMSPPPVTLASVTTSSAGSFTAHVTIPADVSGTKTISVVGGAPAECLPNTLVIHIQTAPPAAPGNHLSNTGVDILTGVLIALALLCLGLFLTRTGSRRGYRGGHALD